MTSTNSSRNVTVGTTNRSAATIWLAWVVRKVRHVCDGGRGCRRMYFATVDWLTVMPNFCSSPWMRGAPQSGFAVDSSRISARVLASTVGRPVRRRLFQVQKRRKPRRCQAMTVAGCTTCSAVRQRPQTRESHAHSSRSDGPSGRRAGRARCITATWCRSARISRCNEARDRTTNRSEWSSETTTGGTGRGYRRTPATSMAQCVRCFW